MTDIALKWIDTEADAALNGADLLLDEGLETAIIISLACDRRADDSDQLPEGETQRRGWWGDAFAADPNDRTGSKLWMLWREKRTQETLQRARAYVLEALQWLIDDGVSSTIDCATSFVSIAELTSSNVMPHEFALVIELKVHKPDGSSESFRFAYHWQKQLQRSA